MAWAIYIIFTVASLQEQKHIIPPRILQLLVLAGQHSCIKRGICCVHRHTEQCNNQAHYPQVITAHITAVTGTHHP